jgi:hypothetical protein
MSIFEVAKNVMLIASLFNPSSAVLSYGVYSLLTYQFIKDVYNSDISAATAQLLYNAGSIYLASSTQPSYSKIALGILTTSLTVIGAYDLILEVRDKLLLSMLDTKLIMEMQEHNIYYLLNRFIIRENPDSMIICAEIIFSSNSKHLKSYKNFIWILLMIFQSFRRV